MTKMFFYIGFIIIVAACTNPGKQPENKPSEVTLTKAGMAISEDTAKLAKLIDLHTYPPEMATFKWNGANTNGLEAVLFYDEKIYGAILTAYMNASFPKGNYTKEQFDFPWLDSAQHAELQLSKPDYTGNPDIFLGTSGKGRLWFLDKKVLLKVQP
ncbi:hypothetical protein [Niabella soli]|uniref:Uncharacterized protein n=1 Tax=Niabella soli DSM 19437 TaxID=929713 RepID=W0F7Z3_9BACT|nr:hypothetical protein [Niabella soli]AHF17579.1 hypothetical protein NIASO_10320 [Niabella soli DSM 19437]